MNTSMKLMFFCGKRAAGKSRKKSSGSRKCCSSGAGRFLECVISWRDHRHSGIRQVLFSIEERTRATHLRSLVGISVVLDFPGNTKV
jgi:hypothetical protein